MCVCVGSFFLKRSHLIIWKGEACRCGGRAGATLTWRQAASREPWRSLVSDESRGSNTWSGRAAESTAPRHALNPPTCLLFRWLWVPAVSLGQASVPLAPPAQGPSQKGPCTIGLSGWTRVLVVALRGSTCCPPTAGLVSQGLRLSRYFI